MSYHQRQNTDAGPLGVLCFVRFLRRTFTGGVCQIYGNAGKVKVFFSNYRNKAESILE